MGESKESFPIFFGLSIEEQLTNPDVQAIIAWITEKIDTLTPLHGQIRLKQLLYDEELMCIKVDLKTSKNDTTQFNPGALTAINYERVFETPKYMRRDGVMECPADSVELTNNKSLCLCPFPHAGPFCQFQCTKEQIDKQGGLCGGTQTICRFTVRDYVSTCIHDYNIGLLDGPLLASAPNLQSVDISWQTANFTTNYHYVINIASAIDTEGEIQYGTFSVDGIRKNISVQELYENGFIDAKLNMYPYTSYTLTLRYATSVLSESPIPKYNFVGSVVFTTPEVAPSQAPQVTAATLRNNLITIEWLLPGQCPGPIRTYDVKILCDAMSTSGLQPENSGNIFYDCGGNHTTNGTQLQANVPPNCQSSRHLKVQLRVGTTMGQSSWSKVYDIPDSSWPLIVIIAVTTGGIVVTLVLGALGFYYYYKRHVKNYQGVYNTLTSLLRSRRTGVGQSFRQIPPPNMDLPAKPSAIYSDSLGATLFEPTPQSQSPRSPAYQENNISVHPSSRPSELNSVHYNVATFFE
uniref:Uncharacterized protein n=1 Tax=Plectus sambesii TaxID=2011161 RepID=A0A914UWN8_9BILA